MYTTLTYCMGPGLDHTSAGSERGVGGAGHCMVFWATWTQVRTSSTMNSTGFSFYIF